MLILGNEPAMEDHASDAALDRLVSRITRSGHHLTSRALERIHAIITDCLPDDRLERGSMKDQAKAIQERMDRDR